MVKMIIRFKQSSLLVFFLTIFSLISIALADSANYASTTIWVNVPTDTSFTMTVLGCGATTISSTSESSATNTTGDISFNSTGANDKEVQAQSIVGTSASCTTPTVQSANKPIIQLQPAGNVNLNFSIKLDVSIPSDLSFKFNGSLFNNTQGCVATATDAVPVVNTIALTTSYQLLARGINKTGCIVNVTAFANFSSSPAAERKVGLLITNATNLQA